MIFDFLEYFYTTKYDNEIILKNNSRAFSVLEVKKLVSSEINFLKSFENKNILINTENYFNFIIVFIACIFADKHIWFYNNNRIQTIDNAVEVGEIHKNELKITEFNRVNPEKVNITIFTSGTTSTPQRIDKTLKCVLIEAEDIFSAFSKYFNKKYEFVTTTPINHLFAITAYIILPLISKNIINTERINYPEDLNIADSVLITSPSFLTLIRKNHMQPSVKPEIIMTAGAMLDNKTCTYWKNYSKVINIYGCTEAGVIGYNENTDNYFKLFNGIQILASDDDSTSIHSNYSLPEEIILSDVIKEHPNNIIEVEGRKDRILKIQEKRVSAKELEEEIIKNIYVNNCRLIEVGNKIGALTELSNEGVEILLKKGIVELTKKLKSELIEKFNIIPQKWKFIDTIPVNKMGKYDNDKIREIFNMNLSLPYILKRDITGKTAEFEIFFYKNCNFFKGHFDNFPIVAGVVQLFYASFFAKNAFGLDCKIGQIRRIKFSSIIHADSVVKLKLSLKNKDVQFEYFNEDIVYSSGCLPIENSLKEIS